MSGPVHVIIPARGGSRGIPNKNLERVGGRSLLGRTIQTAKACPLIDSVWVSSDSSAIVTEAEHYGARTIIRPREYATDEASTEAVVGHALEVMDVDVDIVIVLQCTSPFTTPGDISEVVEAIHGGADSVFTGTPFHGFLWKEGPVGMEAVDHDASVRPRRQDRDPRIMENGAVYGFRANAFLEHKHRFFGRTETVTMPADRSMEIDEPEDLVAARNLNGTELAGGGTVHAVAFDFDGVMTDGHVWTDADGQETVVCHRSDGLGIARLMAAGVPAVIISSETNSVVAARARKLGIEALHGIQDKEKALLDWLDQVGVSPADAAFLGNDVNDLPAMAIVGYPVAVMDAHPDVRGAARFVAPFPGGRGAVRAVCDWIIAGRA